MSKDGRRCSNAAGFCEVFAIHTTGHPVRRRLRGERGNMAGRRRVRERTAATRIQGDAEESSLTIATRITARAVRRISRLETRLELAIDWNTAGIPHAYCSSPAQSNRCVTPRAESTPSISPEVTQCMHGMPRSWRTSDWRDDPCVGHSKASRRCNCSCA